MSEDKTPYTERVSFLIILFIVVFTIQLLLGVILYFSLDTWSDRGMFGVVNSLFSGLALAGIFYAIFLQRRDLKNQREELELTRAELEKSANGQESSLTILSKQLETLKSQIANEHELSRRRLALEVLETFSNTLDRSQPSARNVIEGLSIEDCVSIRKKEPIQVSATKKPFIQDALQGYINDDELEIDESNQKVPLNTKHVSQLHYLAVTHLNSLEIALLAWHNGISDKDILENQLQYLIKPDHGYYFLENFRKAMGGSSAYPAIAAFVDHLKNELNRSVSVPKPRLGN